MSAKNYNEDCRKYSYPCCKGNGPLLHRCTNEKMYVEYVVQSGKFTLAGC